MTESDVNFVPNTLYLDWNTIFPAVTVCETYLGYKNTLKKLTDLYRKYLKAETKSRRHNSKVSQAELERDTGRAGHIGLVNVPSELFTIAPVFY